MYAFKYFQTENNIPLEWTSRVFYKIRSSARRNVCRACYKLNLSNIHRREITGRCKVIGHRGVDISETYLEEQARKRVAVDANQKNLFGGGL